MDKNSLLEFGSKVDVVLSFISEVTVDGKTYSANEPYLFLKDVEAVIDYTNIDKSGQQGPKTLIANSVVGPRQIHLGSVPLTKKLICLLASIEAATTYNKSIIESGVVDNDGDIYISDQDLDESEAIYVYNSSFESVSHTYSSGVITITDSYIVGAEYIISFSSARSGIAFNLEKPSFPYMKMEIQGVGNIDKIQKEVVMVFNKVSLNSLVRFNFVQDDMINIPITFRVIDSKFNLYFEE